MIPYLDHSTQACLLSTELASSSDISDSLLSLFTRNSMLFVGDLLKIKSNVRAESKTGVIE